MKSFENRTRAIVFLFASMLLALLVMCMPAAKGQSTGGRIRGTVTDPSGGAGIQADLKTFHQFGVYGMAAITAPSCSAAPRINGVCEGTLTASFTALRTPRSASKAMARSTAPA